jgi:redox-sensitive bicupin YhaK (pirin superfamily)
MEAGARVTLPAAANPRTLRMLYVHGDGARVRVGDDTVNAEQGFEAAGADALPVTAETPSKILMLQAVDIGEPVVVKGPFVMNTMEEINQAYKDYKATHFGWDEKWDTQAPIYGENQDRFADFGDGIKTFPPK